MESNEFSEVDFDGLREKAKKILNNKNNKQLGNLEEMSQEEIRQLFRNYRCIR